MTSYLLCRYENSTPPAIHFLAPSHIIATLEDLEKQKAELSRHIRDLEADKQKVQAVQESLLEVYGLDAAVIIGFVKGLSESPAGVPEEEPIRLKAVEKYFERVTPAATDDYPYSATMREKVAYVLEAIGQGRRIDVKKKLEEFEGKTVAKSTVSGGLRKLVKAEKAEHVVDLENRNQNFYRWTGGSREEENKTLSGKEKGGARAAPPVEIHGRDGEVVEDPPHEESKSS